MDVSTSIFEDEHEPDTSKNVQAGEGNYEAVRDAWGSQHPFQYPDTRRDESNVESFAERRIVDAYRWLENPVSEETQLFIDDQNNLTETFLEKALWRDAIRAKLTEMWDFKKTECPKKFGSRYFFMENAGLQNQPILYVKESLDSDPRVLMDPNELSMEGAASISSYSVSPNGEYIAYSISDSGSDWGSVYIKNVASGQNFLEVLNFTKLVTMEWTNDNRGFFYPKFPKTKSGKVSNGTDFNSNQRQKLYYHRIGTRQDDDVLVVEFPDHPTWIISTVMSLDGRYLLISAGDVVGEQQMFYIDIGRKVAVTRDIEMFPLFTDGSQYHYLANDDKHFVFLTNSGAPNFKVISFNLATKDKWTTVVEEHPSAVIVWARAVANDKLAICYNEHIDTRLEVRKLDNGELVKTMVFEENISTWDYYGRRDLSELYLRVESYLNPGSLYCLYFDGHDGVQSEVFEKLEIPYYDPGSFTSDLVFYSNDDGTNIPMTLIYKTSTPLDGSAPCLLTGNGSFGESLLPQFHVPYVLFAQNFDGVVAIANIRGGGEYGKSWWDEGRLLNKHNAIEDFMAAANFLVNNKYTRASRLTLVGVSYGATTAAAAINRRPDLFGSAILDLGVMDLLRFHIFTLGHLWISEYGDVENEDELQNILNYSPLHNINAPTSHSPQYPAILVTAADHDDTVVPFHSYKYIAELQYSVGQTMTQSNPLMLRTYQNIGHSKNISTMKAIEKATDVFCFLENSTGYEFHF